MKVAERQISRKRAFFAVLPFVLLGLADVALLLEWGLDPLWGFMILPPILFVSVIAWIAFRSGFTHREDTAELGDHWPENGEETPQNAGEEI